VLDGLIRDDSRAPCTPAPAALSPRETQTLELVALGLTNHEVAEKLTVTVHAVKFHLGQVYKKLGVTNRTEAAIAYLRLAGRATKD